MIKKNPVFVRHEKKLVKIYTDEIRCLVVERNYTRIHVDHPHHLMVRCTLDSALAALPKDEFIKIHRSYAVSIQHIEHIEKNLVRISGQELPIARQFYKSVMEKLPIIENK